MNSQIKAIVDLHALKMDKIIQITCVAVSPSNFKLCALRDRDNLDAELRSNSSAAARFLNSTETNIKYQSKQFD